MQTTRVVSPTLNVDLELVPNSFIKSGIIIVQCCNYCHLLSDFSYEFQSFVTISHYKNDRMQVCQKVDEIRE